MWWFKKALLLCTFTKKEMWIPDLTEMPIQQQFNLMIKKYGHDFHPIFPYDPLHDKIGSIDLSDKNPAFSETVYTHPDVFTAFINERKKGFTYLMGGYAENRAMYSRSKIFDRNLREDGIDNEPRTLHLGIDVWCDAHTVLFAPLGGMVESFAYHGGDGDYGATVILQHQLETVNFYSLYGHLSKKSLEHIRLGQVFSRGEQFATIGTPQDNGNWPPHLHLQLMFDLHNYSGDYPGVCKKSESEYYLSNCPNPAAILKW